MPSRELTQAFEAEASRGEALGISAPPKTEFTRQYQLDVRLVRDNALRVAKREWSNVSVSDIDGSLAPWRSTVATVTNAAVRSAVEATNRYLTNVIGERVEVTNRFVSTDAQLGRRLERAAIVMKVGVAQRRNDEEVLALGLNRALQVIRDEVTDVPARALDLFNTNDARVVGWVRVTWGTCDLCGAAGAGGNVVPSGDTMRRHPNCQCVAVPVMRSEVSRAAVVSLGDSVPSD